MLSEPMILDYREIASEDQAFRKNSPHSIQRGRGMIIGVPAETAEGERRVALVSTHDGARILNLACRRRGITSLDYRR
jgi:hypothetical protein